MSGENKLLFDFTTDVLKMAGLPNVGHVVGRKFIFSSGKHFVAGTITSIGYGPQEGVLLYVSAPRLQGLDIRRLEKGKESWEAVAATGGDSRTGTLLLL